MQGARFVVFLHVLLIGVVLPLQSLLDHWLKSRSALGLQVHANGDQLFITWNPQAIKVRAAILEISDGPKRITWSISPELRSVTYVRDTDDTEIRLMEDGTQMEVARCLWAHAPTPKIRVDDELKKFDSDLADVRALRETVQNGTWRVLLLQREALRLLNASLGISNPR